MLEELIKDKVYYKIFDRTHNDLTHQYVIKNSADLTETDQVKKNIATVVREFNADKLLLLNQVHGNNVVCDEDFTFDILPTGDASVTTKKNIVLGIFTADCVPILFASVDGSVIGAAHCGWKSAKAGIIEKVAKIVRQKGGKNLRAIICPSIAQESYEVSENYYQDFINDSSLHKAFFIDSVKPNHYMFDLPGFVKLKLAEVGVEIIKHFDEDTYMMKDKYPSFRRHTHTGEEYYQSILSAIVIR
jgi:YfiH family protein